MYSINGHLGDLIDRLIVIRIQNLYLESVFAVSEPE